MGGACSSQDVLEDLGVVLGELGLPAVGAQLELQLLEGEARTLGRALVLERLPLRLLVPAKVRG